MTKAWKGQNLVGVLFTSKATRKRMRYCAHDWTSCDYALKGRIIGGAPLFRIVIVWIAYGSSIWVKYIARRQIRYMEETL